MKVHLLHVHGIYLDKDTIDDRTSLIWRYFTEKERYIFVCNICGGSISSFDRKNLELHLICLHSQKIEVQEKFKHLWISHHYIYCTQKIRETKYLARIAVECLTYLLK